MKVYCKKCGSLIYAESFIQKQVGGYIKDSFKVIYIGGTVSLGFAFSPATYGLSLLAGILIIGFSMMGQDVKQGNQQKNIVCKTCWHENKADYLER